MDLIVTKTTTSYKDKNDTIDRLLKSMFTKKKYFFIYDGIKFISDKEIIGVEPDSYKLIYKKDN